MQEIKKQYAIFDAKVLSKIPVGPLKDKKNTQLCCELLVYRDILAGEFSEFYCTISSVYVDL